MQALGPSSQPTPSSPHVWPAEKVQFREGRFTKNPQKADLMSAIVMVTNFGDGEGEDAEDGCWCRFSGLKMREVSILVIC